jgi:hypothetical protein
LSRRFLIDDLTSVSGFGVGLRNSITFFVTHLSISTDVGFVPTLVALIALPNAGIV